jgi:hypothetical protein
MSATNRATTRGGPVQRGLGLPLLVLVVLVSAATVAGIIVSNGNPIVALAPVGAIVALYMLLNLPLRLPALGLLFFGLVLENPAEELASGLFKSPLWPLGWLITAHWNLVIPLKALVFSGIDVALVFFFALGLYRRATASRIDGAGFVETASPMRFFGWVTVLGTVLLEVWGAARGGMDFANSLWQIEHYAYLPLLFLAFHYAFRGPQDQAAIGKTIIVAAVLRAILAYYLRHFWIPNTIETMPTATTHTDSMLFAGAFCLCVGLVLEIPSRRNKLLCIFVLPVLAMGILANNRRIAWVEIGLALGVLFTVMPMTPLKRKLIRWTLFAVPVVAIYLAIGWGKTGGFFRVAAMVRSLVDSKTDASTEWRELENLDLVMSLRSSPVLGLGFGHRYIGPVNIEDVYAQEHFLPHNSLLGVWAFGGIIGFTLNWMFLAVGCFVAVRTYRMATRAIDRVAVLSVLQMVMIYMNHCYGDLGLGTTTGVLLVAPALSVVGKLALTTGAWPAKGAAAARASP